MRHSLRLQSFYTTLLSSLTQVKYVLHLDARFRAGERQARLFGPLHGQAELSDEEEGANGAASPLHLSAGQPLGEIDACG